MLCILAENQTRKFPVVERKKKQASALESEQRVRRAQELLLTGLTSAQVNNRIQKEFGIKYSQAKVYICKATDLFVIENPQNKTELRSKYTAMMLNLFHRAYGQEHWKTAHSIIESLAKVSHLYEVDTPDTKIQITYSPIKKEE